MVVIRADIFIEYNSGVQTLSYGLSIVYRNEKYAFDNHYWRECLTVYLVYFIPIFYLNPMFS